jgi:lysophospholipase L1-like esterase
MRLLSIPLLVTVVAAAAQVPSTRIIFVGDSTVAVNNGWGPGFCALLKPDVACLNMAKNGRSSGSYRVEGSWDQVLAELKKPGFGQTWVLIQFGHNDQPGKPGRSTDLAKEFPENLRGYVREVRAAGATPVLVTSLTRRTFRKGKVADDLGPWAAATRRIAAEEKTALLDLNTESTEAVQRMGGREANTLAMAPPPAVVAQGDPDNSVPAPKSEDTATVFDYTHLGPAGSAFFGKMVAAELQRAIPATRQYFK